MSEDEFRAFFLIGDGEPEYTRMIRELVSLQYGRVATHFVGTLSMCQRGKWYTKYRDVDDKIINSSTLQEAMKAHDKLTGPVTDSLGSIMSYKKNSRFKKWWTKIIFSLLYSCLVRIKREHGDDACDTASVPIQYNTMPG